MIIGLGNNEYKEKGGQAFHIKFDGGGQHKVMLIQSRPPGFCSLAICLKQVEQAVVIVF